MRFADRRDVLNSAGLELDRLGIAADRLVGSHVSEHHEREPYEVFGATGGGALFSTQMLEDVVCLVFLENYFSEFASAKEEGKLLTIIRRTWSKMSDRGREAALALKLRPQDRAILQKALTTSSGDSEAQ